MKPTRAPQGICPGGIGFRHPAHPRWLYSFLKSGHLPDLTVPNIPAGGEPAPTFFGAYGQWRASVPPSWDDVAWLREQWGGPFMLKGVTRLDDAKRAVDAGVTAISVSNHGGDVAKAFALGAKAVMIGRAYLWGLAANGQAGVENVLDLLHAGLDSALLGLGHSSVGELSPADLVIPGGFTRRLGE
jgi:pre-mycofactocin synthase